MDVNVNGGEESTHVTPIPEIKRVKSEIGIAILPPTVSYPQLSSTLANLEREVRKRGSSGYDKMTVGGFHVTIGENEENQGKKGGGGGIVIKKRMLSSGGKGGGTTKLVEWKLPGGGRVTGGVKRSIYRSNKPIDVTNATAEEMKSLNAILKNKNQQRKRKKEEEEEEEEEGGAGKERGGTPKGVRDPLLEAPLLFIDRCVPDNMTVLFSKFLREGEGGETIVDFYKRREAKRQEGKGGDKTATTTTATVTATKEEPFSVGVRVGMGTDEGHVRRGVVAAKHSLENVFVVFDDDDGKRKRKIRKKLLSIIEVVEDGEEEDASIATSKSSGVPSMSSFSPAPAAANLPRPSDAAFWCDVGPVSASRLSSALKKKRKAAAELEKSTRKVTRASIVREARGGGGEKGVDTNKRESKRKRLAAAAAAKEEEEEEEEEEAGLSDDDENFVGYFGKDAKLQEKEKIVSFAPTPRIGSTKRVRMPTLPKGGVASKRTRRMKQKQHDLELELELDFEHEVELAEHQVHQESTPRRKLGIAFTEAVLGEGVPSPLMSPQDSNGPKKRNKARYGRTSCRRLDSNTLAQHTKLMEEKEAAITSRVDDIPPPTPLGLEIQIEREWEETGNNISGRERDEEEGGESMVSQDDNERPVPQARVEDAQARVEDLEREMPGVPQARAEDGHGGMPDVILDVTEIGDMQNARDLLDLASRRAKEVRGEWGLEGGGENDSQDEVKKTMDVILRKFGAD
ncbi:hypothetical protein TrRE_jg7036 [Triparma retinervis]|uniref:Uncharacterized protein n=1 Tax=Triparma retinervis TaxID=2557542 RepID=A0A9W7E395_9STRA|nr:hypothetical protein TrRE_jg7036 [Triparma retinervis]